MFLYNYFSVYIIYLKHKRQYSKVLKQLTQSIEAKDRLFRDTQFSKDDAIIQLKKDMEARINGINLALAEMKKIDEGLKILLSTCAEVIKNSVFKNLVIVVVPVIFIAARALWCQ